MTSNVNVAGVQSGSMFPVLLNDQLGVPFSFVIPSNSFASGNYFAVSFTNTFTFTGRNGMAITRLRFLELQSAYTLASGLVYDSTNWEMRTSINWTTTSITFLSSVVPLVFTGSYTQPATTVSAIISTFLLPF